MLAPEFLGSLLTDDLVVIDVGSRWGAASRWRRFGGRVRVIGFDPDDEECRRLADEEPDVLHVPVALGAHSGTVSLYQTLEPACSSLFPPIPNLWVQRPELSVIRPVGQATVTVTSLDEWLTGSAFHEVHVLKLDTQGSELGVLQGAEHALSAVRLLEIEVEFNPIYAGQPLFGDVDGFLRDREFVLWRLGHLVHYGLAGRPATDVVVTDQQYFDSQPVDVPGLGGQIYWAHAYYVAADMLDDGRASPSTAARDACAAAAFGFMDLAASRLAAGGLPSSAR